MKPFKYTQKSPEDCLSCCLAGILRLPQKEVPDFYPSGSDPEFWTKVRKFLKNYDFDLVIVKWSAIKKLPIKSVFIVSGVSPRNKKWHHAVLYTVNGLWHDPSATRKGLVGDPKYALMLIPFLDAK